ncbi:MAG TPA: DUF58 domain-containing protein [Steroidobacteraceae bacterium]|jgi:uncharacterized protein (DUF58 family)|nr:DUF58 domain-containing protein [Steroidobacteraceae bacterium]
MIVPDLAELLALRGAAHGLSLHGRRTARATLVGAHSSAQRGRGLEFQEVRPYVAGDDPRTIDWRVTARRGRPHTKLFREERERPVWLLVDLQPGLFFGTRRQLKSALAVRTAALLAWVASLGGDRVGALIAHGGAESRILPARARQTGVLPLLEALLQCQPRVPGQPAPLALEGALRALLPLVRPGSQILAVSDFAGLREEAESLWTALAAHSDLRLFWITDPLEEEGLPNGRFRAGLPGRLRILEGARIRERWRQAWREREARIGALAQRSAAPVVRLDTREPVEQVLRPLLRPRQSAA